MVSSNFTESINIIGSGSLGHLLAAYLSKHSISNQLFTKKLPLQKNVLLRSSKETFTYSPNYKLFNQWAPATFIIIAVKAKDLESVCKQLSSLNENLPPIILLMNGLGLLEIANHYLPDADIYHASVTHGAKKELLNNNITIHHTGFGEILIGCINKVSNGPSKQLKLIITILNKALAPVSWHDEHKQALWIKLLINSIINPLTCVYDIRNGEVINNPKINQQAKKLTKQLKPLISHYLPNETWQSIFKLVESVSFNTALNSSSMREDVLAGQQTEIDYITGYILSKAKKLKINLPDHQIMMRQVKDLEKKASI